MARALIQDLIAYWPLDEASGPPRNIAGTVDVAAVLAYALEALVATSAPPVEKEQVN